LARPHRAGTSGVRVFRAAPAVSCRLMDALICGQGRRTQHAGSAFVTPCGRQEARELCPAEDKLTGKPVTESNLTLMRPRTSPLFGMTGPAWRRGPRSVKIRMIGAITRSLMHADVRMYSGRRVFAVASTHVPLHSTRLWPSHGQRCRKLPCVRIPVVPPLPLLLHPADQALLEWWRWVVQWRVVRRFVRRREVSAAARRGGRLVHGC